jgi:hypothetical protein
MMGFCVGSHELQAVRDLRMEVGEARVDTKEVYTVSIAELERGIEVTQRRRTSPHMEYPGLCDTHRSNLIMTCMHREQTVVTSIGTHI